MIAHEISSFFKESFYKRQDSKINLKAYIVCINKKTGLSSSSINRNKGTNNYKEFSYIKCLILSSFKLLIQELETININLRIIL